MTLIKNGKKIEDPFVTVSAEDALPVDSTQAIIVDVERWQNDKAEIMQRAGQIGILLEPDQSPDLIAADLANIDLFVLNFPVFSDGRGFSHARRLRETYGFTGEIRAVGHIIRDQFLFLHRCGVNAITLGKHLNEQDWDAAMDEFSLFYQNAVDTRHPLMRLRQSG